MLTKFKIEKPIIQAPMAGATSPPPCFLKEQEGILNNVKAGGENVAFDIRKKEAI